MSHEMQESINRLALELNELKKKKNIGVDRYSSEMLNELFDALAKAQGEYKQPVCNRQNSYWKQPYTDLDEIRKCTKEALTRHNLAFIQQLRMSDDDQVILHSIISHSSGQWMESRIKVVPPKNDPATFESVLTHLRRNAAIALLGITLTNDLADDDGVQAMLIEREEMASTKGSAINPTGPRREDSFEPTITKEQLEQLEWELQGAPDTASRLLLQLKIRTLADMPKSKYRKTIEQIREIRKNLDSSKSS